MFVQAVLEIGVLSLAAVIFRLRLTQTAQVPLVRLCPPLGRVPSWQSGLLVFTRKHGPNCYIIFWSNYPYHCFPCFSLSFARAGRTILFYASSSECAIVCFFLYIKTWNPFTTFILSYSPFSQNLFASNSLSVYVLASLYTKFLSHDLAALDPPSYILIT